MARNFAERQAEHFHAETGAAHAEKSRVSEPGGANIFDDARKAVAIRNLILGDAEPGEPLAFVGIGPERSVAGPEAMNLVLLLPIIDRVANGLPQFGRKAIGEALDGRGRCRTCAVFRGFFDGGEQLIECVDKKLYAFLGELIGDGGDGNSGAREVLHYTGRLVHIFLEAGAWNAMIAESIHRGWRHGVDGIGADQFLNVENIPVGRIFRTGAGPQDTLRLGATRGQRLPALAAENALVNLIGEFGVGDGDFALQAEREPAGFVRRRLLGERGKLIIDERVDAADKETGHAGHPARIAAAFDEILEPGNVSVGDALVNFLREQERHVDVDAFADQLAKGGNSLARAGNLNHDVRTVDGLPKAARLGDGLVGLVREIGRDFEADVAIAPFRLFINSAEGIRGILHVTNGKLLINGGGVQIASRRKLGEHPRVVGAAGDRFLEYGGIRGHAAQTVFANHARQLAGFDEVAANVIQPDGLTETQQSLE